MAILPNSDILPQEAEIPAVPQPGPSRLSIRDYLARQQRRKEATLTRIPVTEKPKHRRGGKIVKLRRQLADLKSRINADPPPPWNTASELWILVDKIEAQMLKKNKINTDK